MTSKHRKRLQRVVDVVFDGNQKAAANEAGVDETTLHRILTGKTKMPSLPTLDRLASAYGVTVDWLTGKVDHSGLYGFFSSSYPDWFWILNAFWYNRTEKSLAVLAQLSPNDPELTSVVQSFFAKKGWATAPRPLAGLYGAMLRRDEKIPANLLPAERAAVWAHIHEVDAVIKHFKRWGVL